MKTTRRSGISQSMDLFIIIAVVLACGGIVAAAATGLIGSATSQSSLQVTQSTLVGGSTAVLTLQLKNVGTTTISLSTGGTVTIAGITALTAAATCGAPTVSQGTWAAGTCALGATTISYSNTGTITLAPGAQLSFSATISGGTPQPILSGTTYPVTYVFGSVSNTVKLTAQ